MSAGLHLPNEIAQHINRQMVAQAELNHLRHQWAGNNMALLMSKLITMKDGKFMQPDGKPVNLIRMAQLSFAGADALLAVMGIKVSTKKPNGPSRDDDPVHAEEAMENEGGRTIQLD